MQRKKWRPTSNIYSTNSHRWLRCDVILGAPSKNCLGSGICRIVTAGAASASCGCLHHLPAYCLKWGQQQLQMAFNLQSAEPALVRRHFSGSFVQEESVQVPKDLHQLLGLTKQWILPGTYALQPLSLHLRHWRLEKATPLPMVVFALSETATIIPQLQTTDVLE
jgi:hypothetical protein